MWRTWNRRPVHAHRGQLGDDVHRFPGGYAHEGRHDDAGHDGERQVGLRRELRRRVVRCAFEHEVPA